MLYGIPARTGTRIEPDTRLRLADHPGTVAVEDCAYDLPGIHRVMSRTGLAYCTGCDEYVLALHANGGAGCVGTVAKVTPGHFRATLDAFDAGRTAEAARLRQQVCGPVESRTAGGQPGTVTVKALLGGRGGPVDRPRPARRCGPPAGRRPTGCGRRTNGWPRRAEDLVHRSAKTGSHPCRGLSTPCSRTPLSGTTLSLPMVTSTSWGR